MGPNIKTLAKLIENAGFDVRLERSFCNTDRKIAGTRLRHPGNGKIGYKLVVSRRGVIFIEHDTSQTYRTNSEVISWMNKLGISLETVK